MLGRTFRFLLGLALIPAIIAFVFEAGAFFADYGGLLLGSWAAYAFFGYLLLDLLILGNQITFIRIFEHELGHVVARWLLLKPVHRLEVDVEHGGLVAGPGSCFLITLAPYFLPLFTLPFLAARWLLPASFGESLNVAIGLTLGFHYAGLLREFSYGQSDLRDAGAVFSTAFTFLMNLVLLIAIAGTVLDRSIRPYFESAFRQMPLLYEDAYWTVADALSLLGRLLP